MLIQRLGESQRDEEYVWKLIGKIQENPGCCNEVWLTTYYGFPPIDAHKENAERLARIAKIFRDNGIAVSLQLSNTIGHGDSTTYDCSGLVYPESLAERLVGSDGVTAKYSFCPNGEHFREYTLRELSHYAKIQPDCIWVDDDFRPSHHRPVKYGCFCENCMKSFNDKFGFEFSRQELVDEINNDESDVREKWISFVKEGYYDLMYLMCETVHRLSPNTVFGLQSCSYMFGGIGFDYVYSAMKDATGHNPRCRPGGGVYDDDNPVRFLEKCNIIDLQAAQLPAYIDYCCPEIENLPDIMYGKSINGICFETTLLFAHGSTHMSYAMLMEDYESLEWHGETLAAFSRRREYWEKMAEYNKKTVSAGLRPVTGYELWRKSPDSKPFSWTEITISAAKFADISLPIAFNAALPSAYILHSDFAARLTQNEINELMKLPCITDSKTLEVLINRGFKFGVSVKKENIAKCRARFSEHSLNAGFQNKLFPAASYAESLGYVLMADGSETTEILSEWETADGKKLGAFTMIINTKQGGKWVVIGGGLENTHISSQMQKQYSRLADSFKRSVAAVQETPFKTHILPRENTEGKTACVSVVNRTVGDSGKLRIRIRRPMGEKAVFMTAESEKKELTVFWDNRDIIVDIPNIKGWDVGTIFLS